MVKRKKARVESPANDGDSKVSSGVDTASVNLMGSFNNVEDGVAVARSDGAVLNNSVNRSSGDDGGNDDDDDKNPTLRISVGLKDSSSSGISSDNSDDSSKGLNNGGEEEYVGAEEVEESEEEREEVMFTVYLFDVPK